MVRRRPLLVALTCAALGGQGCLQRSWEGYDALYGDSDGAATQTATSDTDGGWDTGGWDTVSSVTLTDSGGGSTTADTGNLDTTSTSTTGDEPTSGSTTAAPAGPPTILDLDLDPSQIHANGPIKLTIEAVDADRIDVVRDDGATIILTPSEDDESLFVGEIPIYTGLDNGEHLAEFVPRRDDETGEPKTAPYVVALPEPGSELFWEVDALSGVGLVGGIGVLPGGDVIELGTRYVAGDEPRCYLRRRDPGGTWGADDDLELFPGSKCEAVDLEISPDGALHVLLRRVIGGDKIWWAGSSLSWGAKFDSRGSGVPNEQAHALALTGETLAVCGSTPAEEDFDAFVQVFRPMKPGIRREFDFEEPEGNAPPHTFNESANDCLFRDEATLVLVGDIFGIFEAVDENAKRHRRFSLIYDALNNKADDEPFIAPAPEPGDPLQSFAQSAAVGPFGDLVIAGGDCDASCPETSVGKLWVETSNGALLTESELGPFPAKNYGPSTVIWSPAGYALVANGTSSDAFQVRAVDPYSNQVFWSYVNSDVNGLQLAFALALGEYGQVYAAGFGSGSFPAIAYIAG